MLRRHRRRARAPPGRRPRARSPGRRRGIARNGSAPASRAQTAPMRHGSRIAATPPGIGDGTEVPDALEPVEVGHQELAAPEGAVGAVAETVEGEPEHRFGAAVLHHARGDVGVVVLHGHDREVEVERRTWSTGTRGAGRGRPPRASRRTARAGGRRPAGTTGTSRGARGRRCGGRRRRRRPA